MYETDERNVFGCRLYPRIEDKTIYQSSLIIPIGKELSIELDFEDDIFTISGPYTTKPKDVNIETWLIAAILYHVVHDINATVNVYDYFNDIMDIKDGFCDGYTIWRIIDEIDIDKEEGKISIEQSTSFLSYIKKHDVMKYKIKDGKKYVNVAKPLMLPLNFIIYWAISSHILSYSDNLLSLNRRFYNSNFGISMDRTEIVRLKENSLVGWNSVSSYIPEITTITKHKKSKSKSDEDVDEDIDEDIDD